MKLLYPVLFLLFSFSAFAQSAIKPADLVQEAKQQQRAFESCKLFHSSRDQVEGIPALLKQYETLTLHQSTLNWLLREAPDAIALEIPAGFRAAPLKVELVKVNPFGPDFRVVTASNQREADVHPGIHYRGVVQGEQRSIAAFSFFPGEVMGMMSTGQDGNLVVGELDSEAAKGNYIIYADADLQSLFDMSCDTEDDGRPYTEEELRPMPGNRSLDDCVGFYYEVDHDIYNDKGGTQGATNFMTGMHNQVATLYANESINTFISDMVIWDTPSPFSSNSSGGMLNDFQAWHNNSSWNGTFGQLVSYQASGGVAATIDGMCRSNRDLSLCFSSVNSSYAIVPTYSWSIMVLTHEFGHLFGSRHTHACVWNGNSTAIDGCAGSTEGFCSLPGIPSNGGTIMSYCHLTSAGINFNQGFGTQPGNVIRNITDNANCLYSCVPTCDDGLQNGNEAGVDCGGPDCPDCPTCDDGIENGQELDVDCGGPDCADCPCTNNLTLTIVLDNYPGETTWEITDADGDAWASGGPYNNFSPGSVVTENICLPNGCYDFTIFDSYGDGICCNYGNGSYQLVDDVTNDVYAAGGQFGSSETTPFCAIATCDDGVQNGDETGVDCGGSNCPPCGAVCDQNALTLTINFDLRPGDVSWDFTDANGNVVESGGPYPDEGPYSTLEIDICLPDGCYDFTMYDSGNDGLCCRFGSGSYQLTEDSSGDILAAGSNYTSSQTTGICLDGAGNSPTCDDGVQNGDETGVDCGGPDCPACPSCNDGIQNGSETGVDCGGSDCPACPSCDDGIQNGNETGVDCGGPDCPPCDAPATCNDGIQNGDEEDVDCGGSDCPACPTCDDGIQNGDEEGVDCGGSDCPACPTCDDGIQNGDEEDVDCGGSDCPACPTCDDGIQNGDEEDVDCGGSDCPACPTCDDGIQNGDEEDVDCGGSDCPACPTCDDGIQNGDETGVDCGGTACVPCGTGCDEEVTLTLDFDLFPSQTSWDIVDVAGTVYGSGGPYSGQSGFGQVQEVVCLPAGCFTLRMYDSAGNGMCCRFGQGSYELTDENGQAMASGGDFDGQENTLFCVAGGLPAGLAAPVPTAFELFPNPTDGQVTLRLKREVEQSAMVRISNPMGASVMQLQLGAGDTQRKLDVSGWPAGLYTVEVWADGKWESKRLMVLR